MAGFAVGASSPLSETPSAPLVGAPPTPFWQAVGDNAADARQTRNTGMREFALRDEYLKRHQELERRSGQHLVLSRDLAQASAAGTEDANPGSSDPADIARRLGELVGLAPKGAAYLDATGYSDQLAKLRAQRPEIFQGIETDAQIVARVGARLGEVRAKAEAAAQDHPFAAFIGQAAGGLSDPANLLSMAGGPESGLAKGLWGRVLESSLQNAAAEAAQVPQRIAAAKKVGPVYAAGEGAQDVAGAFVAGGGLHLGGEGLGAALRAGLARFRPEIEADPVLRGAVDAGEQAAHDAMAIGPRAGAEQAAAADSLASASPPPRVEPDLDIADLFSPEAGGGPDVALYKGRPIYAQSFDPATLQTDPLRFQYKAGGDADGVTARLRGVEAWDPLAAGRTLNWQDRAGNVFIADGHQRFGLVRRLNDDRGFEHSLDGYLFREADGWSAQDVRTVAALKNIREGSGSPLDAAKVFRDAPEALTDRSLPVSGEFMAQARGLAQLEDGAFRAVINKVIPERYGAEIGAMAASRPDLHEAMVGLMKAADPANVDEARALVVESLQDDWIKTEGEQTDLFGYDPSQSAMIGRAKVAATVKRALARDARLFGGLIRHADAIEAGGNALARDANEARLAVDRAALEVAAKLALRHGPIGEAMAAAAAKVTAGEAPATAARPVLDQLRAAIEAGERLDDLRGLSLAPKPPSAAAQASLQDFDAPAGKGSHDQLESAPEDLALEDGPEAALRAGIDKVLEAAAGPGHAPQQAELGAASSWLVDAAKGAGLEIDGYAHVLDGSAVRHVSKNHGDPAAEASRGNIAVTPEDFHALPEILGQPDAVLFGSSGRRGEAQIFYVKAQADGTALVVEEVRTGRKVLAVQSMRRIPGAIDDARLGKLANPDAQDDAGTLKIVHPPKGASAIDLPEAAPPGLFDDLEPPTDHAKAIEALNACAPGGASE